MAISKKLLNQGEVVIFSTRTHVKALFGPLLALVFFLAVGVVVQVWLDTKIITYVVWAIMVVGIVWYVLRPVVNWLTASYTITDRRLITRHGVITRRGHDIPLSRVSDVSYELGLVDRMFGCGTLVISDASTHGQVQLPDIPRVEETQRRLNELLHDMHSASPRDEGV